MRLLNCSRHERDHALYGPVTLYNVRRAAKVNEDIARELRALRDCYAVERRVRNDSGWRADKRMPDNDSGYRADKRMPDNDSG
jgi:hypothetical protein